MPYRQAVVGGQALETYRHVSRAMASMDTQETVGRIKGCQYSAAQCGEQVHMAHSMLGMGHCRRSVGELGKDQGSKFARTRNR